METDDGPAAVALNGLAVRFSTDRTIGPIDLKLPRGSLLGIVGANGSGKTTILRALCGLVRHDGDATILGEQVRFGKMPATLGAMIERPAFIEHGSARFNLAALRRRSDRSTVDIAEAPQASRPDGACRSAS